MTSAVIREWIFGFLQAETSAFYRPRLRRRGLKTPASRSTHCPTFFCHPIFSHQHSAGASPTFPQGGFVRLPPQHVGAALRLLARSTACSETAWDTQPRSLLASPLGSLGIPNTASLPVWLCAHQCCSHQLPNCIRPTFAAFLPPQLDFI